MSPRPVCHLGENFEGIGNLQALNLSDHIFKFVDDREEFAPDWSIWLASCNVFRGSSWHMQDRCTSTMESEF
jgi:hypothetical protein